MCSILSYHILPYLSYLICNISSCLNISHLYCMLSKQHDCIVHFEPCGWKGTAHAARLLDQRKVGSSLARSGSPALAADTYYSNASWHARATTAMWAGGRIGTGVRACGANIVCCVCGPVLQVGSSGYTSSSRVTGWGAPKGWLARLARWV